MTKRGAALFAGLLLTCALPIGAARAQGVAGGGVRPPPKTGAEDGDWPPPIPRYRILATNILGGSYNSEGVEEQLRLGAQMRLYESKSPAFRDNFVFLGINPRVNPTATRIGPSFEIQPLSVFNLKVNLEFVDYFGSLATIQSFPSALDDFSASARERNKEQGNHYPAKGARFSITPFFQVKVGPIVLRNRFTFEYFAIDLKGGDRVFYEPAFDTLVAGHGKMLSDDLDLFYIHDLPAGGFFSHGRIAAGVRYSAAKPVFDSNDFRPGEDRSRERDEMQRVGPIVAFSLFDDGFSKFHEPTIVAMAQWYAAHPNRTGRDMDQAVPYLVLAFIFQSDVWTSADSLSR
jgi:hypothetical protein